MGVDDTITNPSFWSALGTIGMFVASLFGGWFGASVKESFSRGKRHQQMDSIDTELKSQGGRIKAIEDHVSRIDGDIRVGQEQRSALLRQVDEVSDDVREIRTTMKHLSDGLAALPQKTAELLRSLR